MVRIGRHHKRIGTLAHHRSEGAVELAGITYWHGDERYTQCHSRYSHLFDVGGVRGIVRVPEQGHARSGNALLEQLQPLARHVGAENGVSRMFPPGRARLVTSPAPTGSPIPIITVGIVVVACLAARAGGVP